MALAEKFWKNDRGFVWLLGFTVLTVAAAQFTTGSAVWAELLVVRFSLFLFTVIVITSSVLSFRDKVIGYTIACALLIIAFLLTNIQSQILILSYSTLMSLYMIGILTLLIKQIFVGGKMTVQKIGGGVAAYILIGHLWASLYFTIYTMNQAAFLYEGEPISADQALRQLSYFSFVTLTTIGYGDVTTTTSLPRTLAIFEGLIGQLFPAIFIAKLVSLQIEDAKKE